jgi:hypothetical protein
MRLPVLVWLAGLFPLAAYIVSYSAWIVTHGFVAYYAAAQLLVTGQLGASAYDDAWFGTFVQATTGTGVLEIFTPNPPMMALMSAPLVFLDHHTARPIWLAASLAALAAASFALLRYRERLGVPHTALIIAIVLLNPSTFANLRTGQGYLFVFALLTGAALSVISGHERRAGAFLGLAFALKSTGLPLLVLLIVMRRWRAVQMFVLVLAATVGVTAMMVDADIWSRYSLAVSEFVNRPSGSTTAYQTTVGMFRRLCVADPGWNPSPAANCAPVAFVVPVIVLATAMLITTVLALRAPTRLWVAAGVCLCELSLPAAAEPHFVLFAIPLALLILAPAVLALVAVLYLVPLDLTASVFTDGWAALAAYPRLYSLWLLWGLAVAAMVADHRVSRNPRPGQRIDWAASHHRHREEPEVRANGVAERTEQYAGQQQVFAAEALGERERRGAAADIGLRGHGGGGEIHAEEPRRQENHEAVNGDGEHGERQDRKAERAEPAHRAHVAEDADDGEK